MLDLYNMIHVGRIDQINVGMVCGWQTRPWNIPHLVGHNHRKIWESMGKSLVNGGL